MQLHFETLAELREMIKELGYVHCTDGASIDRIARANGYAKVAELTDTVQISIPTEDVERLLEKAEQPDVTSNGAEREPTKRKRRTKAEMEAARHADGTDADGLNPVKVAVAPLDNLKPEPTAAVEPLLRSDDEAKARIAEMAALYDGNDNLAHLNEGREFIAAHGFATYNETMQLAGVPANIAGHTPEQRSRHRAAMAYMAAGKAKL